MARSRRAAKSPFYDDDSLTEGSSAASSDERYDTDPTEPNYDED